MTQADILDTPKLPALEELQARPQWVCWRKEERQGTFAKVPYNARTGNKAQSDNPETWASNAQAVQALRTGTYHGIGYVFHRDYTGIDLDHCVNPDGRIDPWAQAYLDRQRSYAEYSPSKTGVHILVRGTIDGGLRRRVPHASHSAPHPEAAIEMYCERRYFIVTGNHVAGMPTTIEVCPDLHEIHAELTALKPPQKPSQQIPPQGPTVLDDAAVLDQAMRASNGALVRALYRPEKWDRRARSGETYGAGTIARAIAGCHETYPPHAASKIIQFRRKPQDTFEAEAVALPETHLEFVLECLQDEEEGDALLYCHLFRGKCVYDHTEGMWYEWQGHHWERDECKAETRAIHLDLCPGVLAHHLPGMG